MKLYKTTIVIWSEYDPTNVLSYKDLSELGQDAIDGYAYCSKKKTDLIKSPNLDRDWDGTEFFNENEDD